MPAITNLTGTGYLFPLQSGNSGKYLTTDGNVLSWGTPSGGGGLSGSGTTNYISKWTSSSALGNSLVFDDGTNVGIGTATPITRLNVVSSGAGVFAARFTDGVRADLVVSFPASQYAGLDSYFGTGDGGFILRNGTTESVRITPTGNLILNYTSDQGQKFQVNGDVKFGGTTGLIWDNTNEKLGIGTITPGYSLDVLGIISASVDATYNGENGAIIAGNATTPEKRLFIGYDGTNDVGFIQSLYSGVSYKNLVLNPTAGYVGIGTITPTHLLQVDGTTQLMSYTGVGINADSSTMLYVQGSGNTAEDFSAVFQNSDFDNLMKIHNNGKINMGFLPTSATGLSTGDLWNDSGTLKIV